MVRRLIRKIVNWAYGMDVMDNLLRLSISRNAMMWLLKNKMFRDRLKMTDEALKADIESDKKLLGYLESDKLKEDACKWLTDFYNQKKKNNYGLRKEIQRGSKSSLHCI